MKTFLEEYGIAVFVIFCIVILIAIATPVGEMISNSIRGLIEQFTNKANAIATAGMTVPSV